MIHSLAENIKTLAISTCEHPWLSFIAQLVCIVRNEDSNCDVTTQQHLCQTSPLVPAATISILALAFFLLAIIITRLLTHFHHWLYTQQGSANLAVSSAVLAKLRSAQPELHPPSRHSFVDVPGTDLNNTPLLCSVCHESISLPTSSATFTACTFCGIATHPKCARQVGKTCRPTVLVLTGGSGGSGTTTSQLPPQKKQQQPHFWLPEGAVYDIDQSIFPSAATDDDDDDNMNSNSTHNNNNRSSNNRIAEDTVFHQPHDRNTTTTATTHNSNYNTSDSYKPHCCIYCGEPARRAASAAAGGGGGGDIIWGGIAEPIWRCACCARVAHVECYCLAHPHLTSVNGTYHTILGDGRGNTIHVSKGGSGRNSNDLGKKLATVPPGKRDSDDDDDDDDDGRRLNIGDDNHSSGYSSDSEEDEEDYYYDEQAQHRKRRRRRIAAIQRHLYKITVPSPPPSAAAAAAGQSVTITTINKEATSANIGPPVPPVLQQQQAIEYWHKNDVCSLGRHRLSIIPACAVGLKGNTTATINNSKEGKKGNAMAAINQQQQPSMKKSSSSRKLSSKKNKSSSSSSSGKGAWWRRAFISNKHLLLDRSDYRLLPDHLPPGIKPVLVFINVKSGPCIGESLRQKFLRVLHPLQVVTLPKERPEPALELFAKLRGLRIVVAGGDGTVGWILGCIDTIFNPNNNYNNYNNTDTNTSSSSSSRVWMPPPVAVIPLGTGNDLARCLGWGGGYGTWRQGGVGGILTELNRASVALLDRWDIIVADNNNNKFHQRPRVEATSLTHTTTITTNSSKKQQQQQQPSKVKKTMNNYLGIGVDARVALEFHAMRQQHPEWFQSQVGNKMWYTGVGAIDILAKFLRRKMHLPPQSDDDGNSSSGGGSSSSRSRKNSASQNNNNMNANTTKSTMAALAASHHHLSSTMTLICDGRPVRIPPDADGILIINIPSYMGGVDLWGTGVEMMGGSSSSNSGSDTTMGSSYDNYDGTTADQYTGTTTTTNKNNNNNNRSLMKSPRRRQSMYDGTLEVVAVYGSWHLGQLQVGLSRATRVTQAREVSVITLAPLPMQIDGEPFMQQPAELMITLRGQSLMLSRTPGAGPAAEVARAAADVLDAARDRGVLTAAQHAVLTRDMAARVQPFLLQ